MKYVFIGRLAFAWYVKGHLDSKLMPFEYAAVSLQMDEKEE